MSTRETQSLIIKTAMDLFNEHGTKAISTNRVADTCHLSRGNLYYHFHTKEEIIHIIFQQIDRQMSESWFEDHLHPTMEYMHFIFVRQIQTIWRYRFFYLELNYLLEKDARLKVLFMNNRKKRMQEMRLFFEECVKAGLIQEPEPPASMESILQITWFITDQWVPYLNMHGRIAEEANINEGYRLILQVLQPYFTEKGKQQQQQLLFENAIPDGAVFGKDIKQPQRAIYPNHFSTKYRKNYA